LGRTVVVPNGRKANGPPTSGPWARVLLLKGGARGPVSLLPQKPGRFYRRFPPALLFPLIAEAADAEETASRPRHDDFDQPEGVILDRRGPNYIDVNGQPPVLSEEIIQVLGGTHGGGPIPYTDRSKMPPPDCLAFYLPYHYYHPDWWGVYLTLKEYCGWPQKLSVDLKTE
jgi:hypothetical protein